MPSISDIAGALEGLCELIEDGRAAKTAKEEPADIDIGFWKSAAETLRAHCEGLQESEERLRESEEQYRTLVYNIPIGVYRNTPGPEGKFLMANPTFLRIFGFESEEEMERFTPSDLYFNSEERESFSNRLLTHGSVTGVDLRLKKKDGTPIWGQVTARVVHDRETGEVAYFDCAIEDVTERKKSEENLQRHNRELTMLYETAMTISTDPSPDAFLEAVARQLTGALNSSGCAMYLWHPEQETLETLYDYSHLKIEDIDPPGTVYRLNYYPTTRRALMERRAMVIQRDDPQTDKVEQAEMHRLDIHTILIMPLVARDRVIGLLEMYDEAQTRRYMPEDVRLAESLAAQAALAIENARLYAELHRELAERKKAQEALRASEERVRAFIEGAEDMVYFQALDGSLSMLNDANAMITGYSPAEFEANPHFWREILHPDDLKRADRFFADHPEGVPSLEMEYRLRTKSGEWRWIHSRRVGIRNVSGQHAGYNCIDRDITELKRTQEALQHSEERFRAVFEKAGIGVSLVDREGRYVGANSAFQEMTGYSEEELRRMNFLDITHPEDIPTDLELQAEIEAGSIDHFNLEKRYVRKDGSPVWVNLTVSVLRDFAGEPRFDISMIEEITERKRAEELARVQRDLAMRLSASTGIEETLSLCLEGAMRLSGLDCGGIYLVDENTGDLRLAFSSGLSLGFAEDVLHFKAGSFNANLVMKGEPTYASYQNGDMPQDEARISEGLKSIAIIPIKHEGDVIACINVASHTLEEVPPQAYDPLETIAAQIGSVIARVKVEAELRQSKEQLQAILDNSPTGIYLSDTNGKYIMVNRRFEKMRNIAGEKIVGRSVYDVLPKEVADIFWSNDMRVIQDDTPMTFEETAVIGGEALTYLSTKFPLHDDTGRPCAVCGISTNITERVKVEEALRESEEQYRTLINQAPIGIITFTRQGDITSVNPALLEIINASDEGCVMETNVLTSGLVDGEIREEIRRCLDEGVAIVSEQVYQLTNRKDAAMRIQLAPLRNDRGEVRGAMAIVEDISEKRKLEKELIKSQKMQAVGTLAGGVAHEFNNLLTGILGNINFAKKEVEPGSQAHQDMERAERSARRAAELVKQLLTFGRRTHVESVTALGLNPIIEDVATLLRQTIDRRINIKTYLEDDIPFVCAGHGQINQVLMNLCLNARDALLDRMASKCEHTDEVPTIVIETKSVFLGEEHRRYYADLTPGQFVCLTVSDNGCGMDTYTQGQAFVPFFTTKEVGKGTGLGLAMVYGIVESLKGYINLYSEQGVGTTFNIYLPPADKLAAPAEEKILDTPFSGSETILLVDDEEEVREVGRRILKMYGYRVLLAVDGREATKIYEQEGTCIHLVLLDVTMPKLSGQQAMQAILRKNPDAKIILTSGHSTNGPVREALEGGAIDFIQKPFIFNELSQKVRDALDMKPGRSGKRSRRSKWTRPKQT